MQKIILTGPESSGKTTLAKQLAAHFQTEWLPEYAREYLQNLKRPYDQTDLLHIAEGQFLQEKIASEKAKKAGQPFLICDTSFLVLKIWSRYKYGNCHPFILKELKKQKDALFILCGTEIDWEFDHLRENPDEREDLYFLYKKELEKLNTPFIEVMGSQKERLGACLKKIVEN